jgi:hypothetical protein
MAGMYAVRSLVAACTKDRCCVPLNFRCACRLLGEPSRHDARTTPHQESTDDQLGKSRSSARGGAPFFSFPVDSGPVTYTRNLLAERYPATQPPFALVGA